MVLYSMATNEWPRALLSKRSSASCQIMILAMNNSRAFDPEFLVQIQHEVRRSPERNLVHLETPRVGLIRAHGVNELGQVELVVGKGGHPKRICTEVVIIYGSEPFSHKIDM